MNNPVSACIINTKTGEISDTITRADSTALRLKVRDELIPAHGANSFMTVEFRIASFNLRYLKTRLSSDADLNPVTLLWLQYQLHHQQRVIDSRQADYTLAVDAKKDVQARYADNIPMQTLLEDLLDDAIVERGNELNEAKSTFRDLQTNIQARSTAASSL